MLNRSSKKSLSSGAQQQLVASFENTMLPLNEFQEWRCTSKWKSRCKRHRKKMSGNMLCVVKRICFTVLPRSSFEKACTNSSHHSLQFSHCRNLLSHEVLLIRFRASGDGICMGLYICTKNLEGRRADRRLLESRRRPSTYQKAINLHLPLRSCRCRNQFLATGCH